MLSILSFLRNVGHCPSLSLENDTVLVIVLAVLAISVLAELYVQARRHYGRRARTRASSVILPKVEKYALGPFVEDIHIKLGDSDFMYPPIYDVEGRVDTSHEACYSPTDYFKERELSYSASSSGILRSSSSLLLSMPSRTILGVAEWKNMDQWRQAISIDDLAGLDVDGPGIQELMCAFPHATKSNLMRFLVHCDGKVEEARDMYDKSMRWRDENLPPQRESVAAIYTTGAFATMGQARDGSCVFLFRGAFFSKEAGSVHDWIVASAYAIDRLIGQSPTGKLYIICQACPIPGSPNTPVDTEFVLAFVKMVAQNFPERLAKFMLYPFPWWGRAIFSVVSVFLSKRMQERVHLVSGGDHETTPPEMDKFIHRDNVPLFLGGKGDDVQGQSFLTLLDEDLGRCRQLFDERGKLRMDSDNKTNSKNGSHREQEQEQELSPGMDLDSMDDDDKGNHLQHLGPEVCTRAVLRPP